MTTGMLNNLSLSTAKFSVELALNDVGVLALSDELNPKASVGRMPFVERQKINTNANLSVCCIFVAVKGDLRSLRLLDWNLFVKTDRNENEELYEGMIKRFNPVSA